MQRPPGAAPRKWVSRSSSLPAPDASRTPPKTIRAAAQRSLSFWRDDVCRPDSGRGRRHLDGVLQHAGRGRAAIEGARPRIHDQRQSSSAGPGRQWAEAKRALVPCSSPNKSRKPKSRISADRRTVVRRSAPLGSAPTTKIISRAIALYVIVAGLVPPLSACTNPSDFGAGLSTGSLSAHTYRRQRPWWCL
jgi:hypothetical protein